MAWLYERERGKGLGTFLGRLAHAMVVAVAGMYLASAVGMAA